MADQMPRRFSFCHNSRDIVAVLVDDPPAGDSWTFDELCSICNQPLAYFPFYTTDPLLFYIHSHCAYANAAPAATPFCVSSSHIYSDVSQSRSLPAGIQTRHIPSAPYNYPNASSAPPPYSFPNYYQQPYNLYPSTQYPYNPSHAFPAYSANYQSPDQHHYNQYHPPNTVAAAAPSPYYQSPQQHYNQYHPPYNPAAASVPSPYYQSPQHHYNQYHPPNPAAVSAPSPYYESPQQHYNQYHPPNTASAASAASAARPSSSSSSAPGWAGLAATTVVGALLQSLFTLLFES